MLLTPRQQEIVRLAVDRSTHPGDPKWSAGGLLAQIALLSGNTEAELKHWDEVGNGDGPLTLDRLQESGNAFAGWSLDALEALDRVWRAGSGRRALEAVLERFSAPLQPPEGEDAVPPYEGPERRNAFMVAVDIKSLLMLIALIGPLVAVITMVLQVRQDVRGNSVRLIQAETDIKALQNRMSEQEKAKLLYCAGRREAYSRNRGESAAVRFPDAGC